MAEEYNIPMSMIGLLSNRYNHWNLMGTPEGFRKMVKEEYLGIKKPPAFTGGGALIINLKSNTMKNTMQR